DETHHTDKLIQYKRKASDGERQRLKVFVTIGVMSRKLSFIENLFPGFNVFQATLVAPAGINNFRTVHEIIEIKDPAMSWAKSYLKSGINQQESLPNSATLVLE